MGSKVSNLAALRSRLTYANVVASLALFIALGGTSYAITALPKDSVGRKQLKSKAVGPKELAPRTVNSRHIRDKSITAGDLSASAVGSLRGAAGPQGPAGVAFRATMNAAGQLTGGNASGGGEAPGDGVYTVSWTGATASCSAVAGLVDAAGSAAATTDANGAVTVRTFDATGTSTDRPFTVLLGC